MGENTVTSWISIESMTSSSKTQSSRIRVAISTGACAGYRPYLNKISITKA